jgi:hydrogenase maturation protease
MQTLLIALGNPARRDDGAAKAALEMFPVSPDVRMREVMQLTPETAAEISGYDTVIFLDAEVGKRELTIKLVTSTGVRFELAHVWAAEEVVGMARELFQFKGRAYVCGIPALDLSPGEGLSRRTSFAVREAVGVVQCLLDRERAAAHERALRAPEEPPRTLVLGLGNLVLSDDGVGVHAVERLRRDPRFPRGVELTDGGTQGLNLAGYVSRFERVLAIDAIDAGQAPGTIVRLEGPALERMPGKASVHQLAFADLSIALTLLGERPVEIVLLGVQPQSTEWSVELTPLVQGALEELTNLVLEQLEAWSYSHAGAAAHG